MTTTDADAEEARPSAPPRQRRGLVFALAFAVALATFAVFGRVLAAQFVNWDDPTNVYQNPYYVPAVTWANVGHFWTHAYFELYMPVTYSLWALCAVLGRGQAPPSVTPDGDVLPFSPLPFHALNLLLHAGSALAVFALLWRLSPRFAPAAPSGRRALASAAGTLFFALHPLQAESVAWVTGANNVVSGFFGLLALNAYVAYAAGTNVPLDRVAASARRGQGAGWFALATLLYVLALLGKPTATSLPLVALVLDAFVLRPGRWRAWAPGLLLWVALAGAMVLMTRSGSGGSKDATLPLWGRPFIVGDALSFYLAKLFAPVRLTVDYGRHPTRVVLASWWGYVTWLIPVALGLLLWRLRLRWVGVGALLAVASLLPVLGFVPFYLHKVTTVGDRYVYVALLGPALALSWLLTAGVPAQRTRAGFAAAGAVLLLFGALAARQTATWSDSIRLFAHTLTLNPRSYTAYTNLGIAIASGGVAEGTSLERLLDEAGVEAQERPGDVGPGVPTERRARLVAALHCFESALRYNPSEPTTHYHLAAVLMELHRVEPAIPEFREAVRLEPGFGEAWFRLGATLGQFPAARDEAIDALRHATRLQPANAEAFYILGVLLGNRGEDADAEQQFAAVARLTPENAEAHYSLGRVREKQGRLADALPEYREAARLAPGNARFAAALRAAEGKGGATP